jgi:hypothetical protein
MLKPMPFTITVPPPDDFYIVREQQIEDLATGGKDRSLEAALTAVGVSVGFAQNLWSSASSVVHGTTVDGWSSIAAAICICSIVLAVTKFTQYRKNNISVTSLKDRIKAGQKARIGHGEVSQ